MNEQPTNSERTVADPYYKTYVETMHRLNLRGAEAQVYSALLFLCSKGIYKGSYQDLAYFSCCGVDDTAGNAVRRLIEKGLIIKNEQGISMPKISGDNPNISGDNPKISGNSKEKRTKKENIIKEINNNVVSSSAREEKKTATPNFDLINRLFFMDTLIPAEKPAIPANTGYYKIIVLEYGYLNPKKFVNEFYNHWEGKGWPERGNKLFLMRSWMDIYVSKHPKQKPNLSETERLVLRTFLDNIEERLIVRLFNVVTGFDVYDTKIVFVVRQENIQDFAKWLDSLPLAKIFAAYNRIVTVQPAG